MRCPKCDTPTQVTDSRKNPNNRDAPRRRRDCPKCRHRWFTRETDETPFERTGEKLAVVAKPVRLTPRNVEDIAQFLELSASLLREDPDDRTETRLTVECVRDNMLSVLARKGLIEE